MSEQAPLTVDVRTEALVVRPSGDIDMANAGPLREDVIELAGRHDARCVVLDLSAVDYLDSSGIELVFRVHGALTGNGTDLLVVAPPGSRAARVLGLVALDAVGEVCQSLDDALSACGRPGA